jgi:hypothetical protein
MAGWRADGNVLIACNCDWGCPCNFNARPSRGYCEGGWIWSIERGHVEDLSIDGLGIALFAKWPGAIHEGGGRAVCYIDDRADAAQRSTLTRVLRGEIGGPWGLFSKTYTLAEPATVPFELHLEEHATRARIGSVVALELQTIRNPVTQAEVHPEILLPEGLVVTRASLGASRLFRLTDDVQYDHSGQYAAFGRFSYA